MRNAWALIASILAIVMLVALGLAVSGRFPTRGPTFHRSDETVRFDCYETPGSPPLVVTFRDQGLSAVAHYRDRRFLLSHERSYFLSGDVYFGGGATLSVDPEARLEWPGGYSGACQR